MRRALLSLALALAACSETPTTTPPVTHADATTTSSTADASFPGLDGSTLPGADGGAGTDASSPGPDGGGVSNPDASGGDPDASVGPLGPVCSELEICCGTLPIGGQQCLDVAAMADETGCQMRLDQARGFGLCVDPNADAGVSPDAMTGPLTAECAALEPCCAQAGQLAGICTNIVNRNDPMRCQGILDTLAGRGIMCTPPTPDAGAPGDPDAAEIPDASTSTIGADN